MAQLLGYVRYCFNNNVYEDFFFCRALEGYTTGEAIFLKVSEVLEEVRLKWEDCVGVCTDGAAAILGKNVGFHAKVKSLNTYWTYYFHSLHNSSRGTSIKENFC